MPPLSSDKVPTVSRGGYIVPAAPDGNCLYTALAHIKCALGKGHMTAEQMRRRLSTVVVDNSATFIGDTRLKDWIAMETNGVHTDCHSYAAQQRVSFPAIGARWGGAAELIACAVGHTVMPHPPPAPRTMPEDPPPPTRVRIGSCSTQS